MTTPPASLRHFQAAFSQRMRDAVGAMLPDVPSRQGTLYETLLFNNVCGFLDRCFPVSKQRLGNGLWRALSRRFYRLHVCATPYFREIPLEFITYIQSNDADLPAWLPELLHYEWIELAVAGDPATLLSGTAPTRSLPVSDTVELKVNPTLQNLQYHWPVHRLTAETAQDETVAPDAVTCLLVYRRRDYNVQFMQVNPITACLMQLLAEIRQPKSQLDEAMFQLFPAMDQPQLSAQIEVLLTGLLRDEAIFIVRRPADE